MVLRGLLVLVILIDQLVQIDLAAPCLLEILPDPSVLPGPLALPVPGPLMVLLALQILVVLGVQLLLADPVNPGPEVQCRISGGASRALFVVQRKR